MTQQGPYRVEDIARRIAMGIDADTLWNRRFSERAAERKRIKEEIAQALNSAYTAGLAAQREDSVLQPEAEASRHCLPDSSQRVSLQNTTDTEGK